jgi:hypothetical protein
VDLFSRFKKDKKTNSETNPVSVNQTIDFSETTADLEKQLNELKQYDTQQVHG